MRPSGRGAPSTATTILTSEGSTASPSAKNRIWLLIADLKRVIDAWRRATLRVAEGSVVILNPLRSLSHPKITASSFFIVSAAPGRAIMGRTVTMTRDPLVIVARYGVSADKGGVKVAFARRICAS